MLAHTLLTAALASLAAAQAPTRTLAAPLSVRTPIGCPANHSEADILCVGPGANNGTVTWPNATSGWAVGGYPVIEWSPPSAELYADNATVSVYLFNKDASVLPNAVEVIASVELKNGSAFNSTPISADQIKPGTGYWLYVTVNTGINDTVAPGMDPFVYGTTDEFEIKATGANVSYPSAYAGLSQSGGEGSGEGEQSAEPSQPSAPGQTQETKPSGGSRAAVAFPLAAVVLGAILSVL